MRGTVAGSLTGTTLATTPAEPSEIRALTSPRSSSAPTATPTAELQLDSTTPDAIDQIHDIIREHKGEAKLLFDLERAGDFMVVMDAEGYNVLPDRNFIARVEGLCGRGAVRVID